MPGVFLSYRRVDAIHHAGRLFDRLKRRYGLRYVFMDIKGGILRGADFEAALTNALNGCDVLLALIGPSWLTCARSDGRRRLDVADDWVCKEIAAALERKILVVPVLLGGARRPEKADLPASLASFPVHQAADIREESFENDFGELVNDIERQTQLTPAEPPDPGRGIVRLRQLIRELPSAESHFRDSVHASRIAANKLAELKLYKSAHDLLHQIEFAVQRPLKASYDLQQLLSVAYPGKISDYRRTFKVLSRKLALEIEGKEFPFMPENLASDLKSIATCFEAAGESPADEAFQNVLNELGGLTYYSTQLDVAMSTASKDIALDKMAREVEEVTSLIDIRSYVTEHDVRNALDQFSASVAILYAMQQELTRRVRQHKQFQDLDNRLRLICSGLQGSPANAWRKVKELRSQLGQPLPPEWEDRELDETEAQVDKAILEADVKKINSLIEQYFANVGEVFFTVDAHLKEYVAGIIEINPVLNALLAS